MSKTLTGMVTSNKGDKTIIISVHARKTHPLYKKQYSVTTKFMAHDENNECSVGDKVVVEETRPLSARKRFKLREILERAKLSEKDKEVLKADEENTDGDKEEKASK